MKRVFDPNKLLTVLVNGYRTYSDGRHSFNHENLLKVLNENGFKIDEWELGEESYRRYERRNKKIKDNSTPIRRAWLFEVIDDADKHFDLVFRRDCDDLPFDVKCDTVFSEDGIDHYTYKTYNKKSAADVYRWIKKYHPTRTDLKITRRTDLKISRVRN
jgi:hypothetical protein